MNFLRYLTFFLAVIFTVFMNFLGYLTFFLAVIFTVFFIVCMAIQQIVTYHEILEKGRNFSNNKFSLKN